MVYCSPSFMLLALLGYCIVTAELLMQLFRQLLSTNVIAKYPPPLSLSIWIHSSSRVYLKLFLGRNIEGVMERGVWEREPNEIRMCNVRMSGLGLILSLWSLSQFSLPLFIYLSQLIFLSHSFTLSLFQMVCFSTITQLNVSGLLPISFSLCLPCFFGVAE